MRPEIPEDMSGLLQAWSQGDERALERLIPLVDRELRQVARRYLENRRPGAALQTTSLLNETYVRLMGLRSPACDDRVHFFALCASIIRGILVDHARARASAKRGQGVAPMPLEEAQAVSPERTRDVVAIDDALTALSKLDPRRGRVVELRFFGGLNIEETAEALRISPETVKRDWRVAKLWLLQELSGERPHGPGTMAANRGTA